MPKDRSSLCIGFNSNYSMKIGQYVLFILKTCLLGNCIERETIDSILKTFEVRLRSEAWGSLPQSRGLRIFCLSYARDKTKRHLSLFLYRAQNLPSILLYISKLFHNMNLRRMHAQDLRGSFRVDVFDSKKDYPGNFDETFKVDSNDWFRVDYTMWRSLKVY